MIGDLVSWALTVMVRETGELWAQVIQVDENGKSERLWNIERCSDASLLSQEAVTCLDASLCTYLSTKLEEHPPTDLAEVL